MVYDMQNNKSVIDFDNVHSFLEIGQVCDVYNTPTHSLFCAYTCIQRITLECLQVGLRREQNLWMHSDPISRRNETVNEEVSKKTKSSSKWKGFCAKASLSKSPASFLSFQGCISGVQHQVCSLHVESDIGWTECHAGFTSLLLSALPEGSANPGSGAGRPSVLVYQQVGVYIHVKSMLSEHISLLIFTFL